jgi:HAD superfamily hydrolase (TIGR01509 family)
MVNHFVRDYERRHNQERVIVEALDALVALKRHGFKTALVTSKNDIELANSLPRLGISAYCDAIIGADQVAPFYKPHPRPVQLALDQLGVDASQAVFIGDTVHDMQCGRAAGVRTAAVLWGAAPEAGLRLEMPNWVFAQPGEIVPALIGKPAAKDESRIYAA